MSRRVDELFLLARAEAGEALARPEAVELDAVAIEAADLMRGRAHALGRKISLGPMASVEVLGDGSLLREAAVELVENACRHGAASEPVDIAVTEHDSPPVCGLRAPARRSRKTSSIADPRTTRAGGLVSQWFAGLRLPTAESWTMSRRPGAM